MHCLLHALFEVNSCKGKNQPSYLLTQHLQAGYIVFFCDMLSHGSMMLTYCISNSDNQFNSRKFFHWYETLMRTNN